MRIIYILVRTFIHEHGYGAEREFPYTSSQAVFYAEKCQIDHCIASSQKKCSLLATFNTQSQAIPFLDEPVIVLEIVISQLEAEPNILKMIFESQLCIGS